MAIHFFDLGLLGFRFGHEPQVTVGFHLMCRAVQCAWWVAAVCCNFASM
jgi:hypothetical protein